MPRFRGNAAEACPGLPGADGDPDTLHDPLITAGTIIPAGLADTFDLELTVWTCFANARLAEQRSGGAR
jgi:hypothetical protein